MTEEDRRLLEVALEAQKNAHCPFSKYPVGAAVLTADGSIFSGCNVESASFSLTCCAERVAVFKAVSEGHKRILSCSIVTTDQAPAAPCGACRQVLYEFGGDMRIVLGNPTGKVDIMQLSELLPHGFTQEHLLSRTMAVDEND